MKFLVSTKSLLGGDTPVPYQLNGRLIEINPYGKFIVHKTIGGTTYSASEPKTGLSVGLGFDNLDELVFEVKSYMDKKGVEKFSRAIQEHCAKYGVLNDAT
jgi:hypothetical protein